MIMRILLTTIVINTIHNILITIMIKIIVMIRHSSDSNTARPRSRPRAT